MNSIIGKMSIDSSNFSYTTDPAKTDWKYIMANSSSANILQSWEYGEVLEETGNKVLRMVLFCDGQPVSAMLGKYVPVLGFSRALVLGRHGGGSPVIVDDLTSEQELKILSESFDSLEKECRRRRILQVRIHAPISGGDLWDGYRKKGYKLDRYLYTPLHDIAKPVDIMWGNLHQKHRNAIRSAIKKKVVIIRDNNSFDNFLGLKLQHQKLKGYEDDSPERLRKLYEIFSKYDMCDLYFARHNGEYIAAALILKYRKTLYYLYGASTPKSWELEGANTLLHWEIMGTGNKQGYKRYNMWGVASPDKHDEQSRFKARFSKDVLIAPIPVFKKNVFAL